MANDMIPLCPFTLAAGEAPSVLTRDGAPQTIQAKGIPCIGGRCMAHATVKLPNGKTQGVCSRLMQSSILDNLAGMIESLVLLKRAELDYKEIDYDAYLDPTATPPKSS